MTEKYQDAEGCRRYNHVNYVMTEEVRNLCLKGRELTMALRG